MIGKDPAPYPLPSETPHAAGPAAGPAAGVSAPASAAAADVPPWRRWSTRLLLGLLGASVLLNVAMYFAYQEYFSNTKEPLERYHSGDRNATERIVVLKVNGTIMPPFSGRLVRAIEQAADDDRVKGVVLSVDTPGGLVADSHQIYRKLQTLSAKKPVVVSMKRMATSGGYYVAMGAGQDAKIYAEPTTWTGSIGVIIPRYNARMLTEKLGVSADPLKTGEFKDALSPFRELSDDERVIWGEILDDSYQRFMGVIVENRRDLDHEQVRQLATGQIYTAGQALDKAMIDAIGYEEDALDELKSRLGLERVRVVTYESRPDLLSLVIGTAEARQPESEWQRILEATVPQAMYFCSWGLGGPGWSDAP